jgi:hypothetical protein|tara:strand:+ start:3437 stop:3631 length:195 start_codon:yes stop_codon:yes gene_type:complete
VIYLQESDVDSGDLSEALVMHCAEMRMITKNIQNVADSVDRLTSFFIGVLCLNAVLAFAIFVNI